MNKITTIGRVLFALPFAFFGLNHFLMMDYYMGMLTSFIPRTAFVMVLTGVMLIAASISIITKKYVTSTYLLAGLLFLFIVTIHIPHLIEGVDKTVTLIALLKDISLMGGSLMIAGIYSDERVKN